MKAEIHGKISKDGSNLSERLEDKLTGDFFGALRYLPSELGFGRIFKSIENVKSNRETDGSFCIDNASTLNVDFWERFDSGEVDLYLETETCCYAIEVKYLSGLSSDDDTEFTIGDEIQESGDEIQESNHQLVKYARSLESTKVDLDKALILVAPISLGVPIISRLAQRNYLDMPSNVKLGFISWQQILLDLKSIDTGAVERWQKLIIEDLIQLLEVKGFDIFQNFNIDIKEIYSHAYHFIAPCFNWQIIDKVEEGLCYEFKEC